jgi:hypothetical protein
MINGSFVAGGARQRSYLANFMVDSRCQVNFYGDMNCGELGVKVK